MNRSIFFLSLLILGLFFFPACAPSGKSTESTFALETGLELKLEFTFLWLKTQNTGWVRVTSFEQRDGAPQKMSVQWTFPQLEKVPDTKDPRSEQSDPWEKTPRAEVHKRMVTGTIDVSQDGLMQTPGMKPPVLWNKTETESDIPLIWLSQKTFKELRTQKEANWRLDLLSNPLLQVSEKIREMQTGENSVTRLTGDKKDFYHLKINGEEVRLPVLLAHDTGGNTYTILDNPQNPLILSMRHSLLSSIWILPVYAGGGYNITEVKTKE